MSDFDTDLRNEMMDFAQGAPLFVPQKLKDPGNKGIVRSGFQKAMRRGQVDDALRYGQYLMTVDEKNTTSYAWFTLGTVMIEDIGFLQPDLIAYSCMLTLKSFRDKLANEYLVFSKMVERACSAMKTRSCCELELGANMRKETGALLVDFSTYDTPEFTEEMLMQHTLVDEFSVHKLERAYFAMKALRQRYRNRDPSDMVPALEFFADHMPTEQLKRVAMLAFERGHDTLFLALFPLLQVVLNKTVPGYDETHLWPPSVRINTVASEAYDMHTGPGKKAIKALYTRLRKKHQWVDEIQSVRAIRTLGSLIFIEEGGMLNYRIGGPNMIELKNYQDYNFAVGYGNFDCSPMEILERRKLILESIPILNDKRAWAVEL